MTARSFAARSKAACRRRLAAARWLLLGTAILTGCATPYQVGNRSLYPQDVRTVYVPIFDSDSFRRNLGERLTEAVMKEIENKTPYKVVGTSNADSILSGRIIGETKRVVAENSYDDPRKLDVSLQIKVSWIDRSGGILHEGCVALPPDLSAVGGTASFLPEYGQSVATAHQQAIQRVAEQIVGMMEAPW
ncbi:MAG: LPS assembly lipoprotein LptE [Thermoguttaceae bacterium]